MDLEALERARQKYYTATKAAKLKRNEASGAAARIQNAENEVSKAEDRLLDRMWPAMNMSAS